MSVCFHALMVVVILLLGHEFKGREPEPPKVIAVDLLPLDVPIAQQDEVEAPEPVKEEPQVEPEKPSEEAKAEMAPTAVNDAPPPLPEAAPEIKEVEPDPEPIEEEIVEEAPSLAPKMTPRPRARPKIDLPEPEKKVEDKKPEPQTDFASVLKNLAEVKKANKSDPDARQTPMLTQPPPVGQALTRAELSALRRQLAGCWNILPGARDADDIVVRLHLIMNPDRTVQRVTVKDTARLSDPFYKAAAETAVRAVRNPRCSPLELPPFKYDQWKEMTIRFDPKDMF